MPALTRGNIFPHEEHITLYIGLAVQRKRLEARGPGLPTKMPTIDASPALASSISKRASNG